MEVKVDWLGRKMTVKISTTDFSFFLHNLGPRITFWQNGLEPPYPFHF